MQYGHFDDARREYVITRPDTPRPWINYLGCQEYFGIDVGGRYLYLRDNQSREFWSPSWQPTAKQRRAAAER